MSEHLQTRTEHTRSLEDAENYKALETLKELGLLIPYSDVETYHGRIKGVSDLSWGVDPDFANGGNESGNHNLNARSTLYTGTNEVAREFARARSRAHVEGEVYEQYKQHIDSYGFEDREAWLARLNDDVMKKWQALPAAERRRRVAGPALKNMTDLSLRWVEGDEIKRLKERSPQQADMIRRRVASGLEVHVHDMLSEDADATIINGSFSISTLSPQDKQRYRGALETLTRTVSVAEGAPVDFGDRGATPVFANALKGYRDAGYLSVADADRLARKTGLREGVTRTLAGAVNAQRIMKAGDPNYMVRLLLDNTATNITHRLKTPSQDAFVDAPINLEYVERWLQQAHIVGVKHSINSATIGRRVSAVSLFDLQKVDTKEAYAKRKETVGKRLGVIAATIEDVTSPDQPLLNVLEDAHAKPRTLVAAAKKVEGFKSLYEADAGNWEGYSLEEHTESVLQNFDENYADVIPVTMLAPMRLLLLAHDIGKSTAAAHGDKRNQSLYNVRYADEFFTKLGIDDKLKGLMVAIIGRGADLSYDIAVKGSGAKAEQAMDSFARKTLEYYYDSKSVSTNQIDGFRDMCEMLLVCDGGSYTSMALTRSRRQGTYRNAPSFNKTFEKPGGLGRRDLRLKRKK